jgi:hypothetical protein
MSLMAEPRIVTAVSDLADFLDSYGDNDWADRLRKELDGLRAGDERASRILQSYFGGMGNLDDRIFTPANGDPVTEVEGRAATRQFWRLLEEVLQAGLPVRRGWPIDDKEIDRSERRAKRARRRFERGGRGAFARLVQQEEDKLRAGGYVQQPDGNWTRPSNPET